MANAVVAIRERIAQLTRDHAWLWLQGDVPYVKLDEHGETVWRDPHGARDEC